jgi:hypothetical protein
MTTELLQRKAACTLGELYISTPLTQGAYVTIAAFGTIVCEKLKYRLRCRESSVPCFFRWAFHNGDGIAENMEANQRRVLSKINRPSIGQQTEARASKAEGMGQQRVSLALLRKSVPHHFTVGGREVY